MSTATVEVIEQQFDGVINYSVTDAEIAKLREYKSLDITDYKDKAALKRISEARKEVKKTRTGVENHAKKLKEKALEWQRKVNAEKDRIVKQLEEIEEYLEGKEKWVELQIENERLEQERLKQEKINNRMDQLRKYGFEVDREILGMMTDEKFESVLETAKVEFDKEQRRKEEERLEQIKREQEEADRKKKMEEELAAQRKEIERMRQEKEELERQKLEMEAKVKEQEQRMSSIQNPVPIAVQLFGQNEEPIEQKAEPVENVEPETTDNSFDKAADKLSAEGFVNRIASLAADAPKVDDPYYKMVITKLVEHLDKGASWGLSKLVQSAN